MSAVALLDLLEQRHPGVRRELDARAVTCPHQVGAQAQTAALAMGDVQVLVDDLDLDWLPDDIRRSVPHRRTAFVVGRLCAELAMAKLGMRSIGVGRHKSAPVWPEGVVGSISHTDLGAYAAVADRSAGIRVGIDSEVILDAATTSAVRMQCCTAGERARWFCHADVDLLATLIFSVKEALFKAVNPVTARFIEFDEVEVVDIDHARQLIGLSPIAGKGLCAEWGNMRATYSIVEGAVHTAVLFTPTAPLKLDIQAREPSRLAAQQASGDSSQAATRPIAAASGSARSTAHQ